MPALPAAAAVDDVPAAQLAFVSAKHGVRHGGRGDGDLLTHLTQTRWVLKTRLRCADAELLSAALFHSIYGTEGFQGDVLPLSRRGDLRALIGARAEATAHANCVMDRASFDAAVARYASDRDAAPFRVAVRGDARAGVAELPLSAAALHDLMMVHLADWLQQVEAYKVWKYRREGFATLASALGGVCLTAYRAEMAREPANAEQHLPEMVRARKLGVFDDVMSGRMSYDDLYKTGGKAKL